MEGGTLGIGEGLIHGNSVVSNRVGNFLHREILVQCQRIHSFGKSLNEKTNYAKIELWY